MDMLLGGFIYSFAYMEFASITCYTVKGSLSFGDQCISSLTLNYICMHTFSMSLYISGFKNVAYKSTPISFSRNITVLN